MKHKAQESLNKTKESMIAFHERTNSEVGRCEIERFNILQDLINCQLTKRELEIAKLIADYEKENEDE